MNYLQIHNLHKHFPEHHALKGIDLDIKKGEAIAIIGPSGCGKTTLLRCLALLEIIDEGEIVLNDSMVTSTNSGNQNIHVPTTQYRTKTGFVFQNLNIWPHLTVLQNLTLAPTVVHKLPSAHAIEKAKQLLLRMGIQNKWNQYPSTLSGGQLQRVALARALMMDPEILLLDEITSAMDPELVGEILDIITNLATSGITLIIVTHEIFFASEVADRIVFMDDGRIVHQGPARSIFTDSVPQRLSSFIGRLTKHQLEINTDN